ncbi:hypothetical protein SCWH03_57110 [Streptomyces pacificus]|uniref:Uncharacterized protein n=1 Tax=Streptomyces pacificus TaxID=2705029 RepID=A0A6A0B5A4_9ACTN|nr:hypothetical protein SCWH03_57110 [Streptomyces pacificus]
MIGLPVSGDEAGVAEGLGDLSGLPLLLGLFLQHGVDARYAVAGLACTDILGAVAACNSGRGSGAVAV